MFKFVFVFRPHHLSRRGTSSKSHIPKSNNNPTNEAVTKLCKLRITNPITGHRRDADDDTNIINLIIVCETKTTIVSH